MKKLFTTLFFAASMALSACAPKIYKGEDSKAKLEKQEYTAYTLTQDEAKVLIIGINFDDTNVKSVVRADKGKDDDRDFFLGFYFDSIKEAEDFNSKNNNQNLGLMSAYGELQLGKNLTLKVGSHNNVAYVGSETSFKAAF